MTKMDKKGLKMMVIAFVGLLALPEIVYAAQTADISVTVTCRKLSVSVSPASYAFGEVNEGSGTVASNAIVVTNDGNISETFQLKLTNPTNWIADQSGTPGEDHYKLGAIFKTSAPSEVDYTDNADFVSTTYVSCSTSAFSKDSDTDTQKGISVSPSNVRNLWFYFKAPSYSTIGTQQIIIVSIKATAS